MTVATIPRAPRTIGPLGTTARLVGGTAAILIPIAVDGFSVADALVALVALPVIAVIAAAAVSFGFRRLGTDAARSRHGICSGPGCTLILLMLLSNGAIAALTTVNGSATLWVWLGASMLLAAVFGYAGCEVLASWNLVTGRQDQIGCLIYSPIDALERRRTGDPRRH
jgi:hypothetical protein